MLDFLKTYAHVVVAGDLNINILETNNASCKLNNIVGSHSMYCSVDFPTRVSKTKESSIDKFIKNLGKHKIIVTGLITEISDHDGQLFEILSIDSHKSKNKLLSTSRRKFTVNNKIRFLGLIIQEAWLDVYKSPADLKFDVFSNPFMYYFNTCFTLVKCRSSVQKPKWINNEIINTKSN